MTSPEGPGWGEDFSVGEGKRQELSHENQTDGALNIDGIVITGNGATFDRGNEISQEPTSFWHFPLPKTLCRVITVPTVRAWTLKLLSVHCRCQLNSQIIAFFKIVQRIVAEHLCELELFRA